METRNEKDTMGEIEVPKDAMWGAQTQRSIKNFPIGSEKMPLEVIYGLAIIKRASAVVNCDLGLLSKEKSKLIQEAADEVLGQKHDMQFPLVVWQTGSGTQSNMNMNEVLSNLANLKAGSPLGTKHPVHPNDDVNMSQSSNDTFPTANNIAAVLLIKRKLIPNLEYFCKALRKKSEEFNDIVKTGRTHMMDATPLTLGQEFSGFVTQIEKALADIDQHLPRVHELAAGGTAVGTGINTHPKFAKMVAAEISKLTGFPFVSAPNKFESLGSVDALVSLSGAIRTLAVSMYKISNDIRLLGSGPRCGIGELNLPANEPGSSIMPGKVNPTQCESLTQVCLKVMGNDNTIGMAGSQGQLQLNTYRPLVIHCLIQSINLLADSAKNFTDRCLVGITLNKKNIDQHLESSLMLVTALNTHIGYDNAAKIAKKAHEEGKTLKQVALELGLLTAEQFDKWVDPSKMIYPD